jgi:hypothetical protein
MAQRQWRTDDTDQWIYRRGNGQDGDVVISTDTTDTSANQKATGTISTTAVTTDAAGAFANGDIVMIRQVRGSNAGEWEFNKIASGAGTTSLVMERLLTHTYSNTGSDRAQIVEVKQYRSFSVSAGKTLTVPEWNGDTGGELWFTCLSSPLVNGIINASEKGFIGADGPTGANQDGKQGEGTGGAGGAASTAANGNGGGGGDRGGSTRANAGGGGGNAFAGSNGVTGGAGGTVGTGGNAVGNVANTLINFGGGGGGGGAATTSASYNTSKGRGGRGGGIIGVLGVALTIDPSTGMIKLSGGAGTNGARDGSGGGGGGGAGCFIGKVKSALLGTNLMIGIGGVGGVEGGFPNQIQGGVGSVGRIHFDFLYPGGIMGTTNPTADTSQDFALQDRGTVSTFLL